MGAQTNRYHSRGGKLHHRKWRSGHIRQLRTGNSFLLSEHPQSVKIMGYAAAKHLSGRHSHCQCFHAGFLWYEHQPALHHWLQIVWIRRKELSRHHAKWTRRHRLLGYYRSSANGSSGCCVHSVPNFFFLQSNLYSEWFGEKRKLLPQDVYWKFCIALNCKGQSGNFISAQRQRTQSIF